MCKKIYMYTIYVYYIMFDIIDLISNMIGLRSKKHRKTDFIFHYYLITSSQAPSYARSLKLPPLTHSLTY